MIVDHPKRNALIRIGVVLTTLLGVFNPGAGSNEGRKPMSDAEIERRLREADKKNADDVERLYSTKPVRVRLGKREYIIPANYFGSKERDEPEFFDTKSLGFILFLPGFGGFTKDNWQLDKFDTRRIDVLDLRPVDKNVAIPISGGGFERITPAGYGDPKARFENLKLSLIREPGLDDHDLQAYVRKNRRSEVVWTGVRSNGEFFFFTSTDTPGEPVRRDRYPLCDVRYYSEKEDLYIAYVFSMTRIAKWREVDDAIWRRLHHWQVK